MKKPDLKKMIHSVKRSFTTRSFRSGGYSVAATAIVLAIIIAVNLLVQALPAKLTQLDTSSNGIFTLSNQTEQVLASLETDVTLYWIVQSGAEDTTIETFLNRYVSGSSHIQLVKKDPDVYPTFAQSYTSETVSNNSLIVVGQERYRYVDYYDIYAADYSDYYTTGSISYSFTGENALTSAIDYVIREDLPKVYTLTGHGETSLSTTFQSGIDGLNIETEALSLLTVETVPDDADLVLICAPQSDISEEESATLLSYLQSGGDLFLITDPPESGAFTNLNGLMEQYGVTTNEGLVVESDQNYYVWGTPYYLLPEINSHTITSPLLSENYFVLLPVAQGLTVSDDLPDNLSVTELLTTSSSSFSKLSGYEMVTYEKEDGDIDGPFSLAVAVTDTLDDEMESHIVWVSSTALVDETTNSRISGGNLDFFLNSISWMCQQEDRISIHAKSLDYEYLTIDSGTGSLLTTLIIAIVPLAYLAVGIIIWVRRKRK